MIYTTLVDLEKLKQRSALGNWSSLDIRALLNYIAVLEKETASLKQELMFACEFDGYTTVEKDRYDYAIDCMEEKGRDEPSKEDELNGLRRLIDAAMEIKNG